MDTNQSAQIDIEQIKLLTKTIHDDAIYTFTMPNYTKYSHYKEEGKPLLDNASLAIEFLNKQSKDVYQKYLDHQVETSQKIQNLQKKRQELEEAMRKESQSQRQEIESIIQEFMTERFTPSNQSDLIRDSMKALKQTNDVKGYYIEFKRLAVQLSDMTEKDKCKAFIDGLKPGTAAWVRFAQKNTLDEAYTYAVHVETHRMHEISVPKAQNETTTTSNLAISESQSSFNRKGPIFSSFRNKQPQKSCNYCNKAGHNALECRYRIADVNQQKTRKTLNSSQVTCIICSRPGHIAENCYYNKPKPSFMTKLSNSKSSLDIIAWDAHIDGSKVLAALDSASHLSIMSQATANKLGIRHYPTNRAIETSTGDKTTAIGTTGQIQVEFEGTVASISFTVTDLEAYDILLGLDWFDQTGVLLDPKNQSFIIPQRVIKISTKNRDSESIINEDEIEDIATSLNSMNIEAEADIRDDFELCDDYTCFNENPINEMKPLSDIDPKINEQFQALIKVNEKTFASTPSQLGCCKGVEFEIETTTEVPIHSAPYRQAPTQSKALKEEVESLLKAGIIRKGSPGTWASPAFTIIQKQKPRMVTNFKKLNTITKPYKFPQPRIDEHIEGYKNQKIFSKIDLRKGFYQLPIAESSKHKTGFVTPFGIFEFNRLPFGVMNGPAIFCSVMQNIFGDVDFVKCYIDDITIASVSEQEHIEHIKETLKRLNDHDLKINPDKCFWFMRSLPIFGYIIDEKGIRIDPERISPITERKEPTNVKQLQQFLGMTNYYRRFIKSYSKIGAPLHKLCSQSTQWNWSTECLEAFDTLKRKLTQAPILKAPDFDKPFVLHTDASHLALGAVLSQKDIGGEYVCHYASKLLKPSERTYGITELECLSIIWAVNHFRIYLQGNLFTIYTDNEALKWLKGMKSSSMRLSRWSVLLEQFNFEVKHRPGKQNLNADALSRPVLFTGEIKRNKLEDESIKLVDPYEDDALNHYLKFNKHIPGISRKQVNRIEKAARLYKLNEDGSISARKNESLEFNLSIPKPEQRRDIVLREHELNHAKAGKIQANLSARNIYWKNMIKTIDQIIATCEICLKFDKIKAVNNPAIPSFIDNVFDKIGIDIINGLPESAEGFKIILVIIEYVTKFAWAIPLKSKAADEIAQHMLNHICTYGPPKCIISDQVTEFVNEILKSTCDRMSIIRRTTSPYNPRANGQCERTNQTLIRALIKHCNENPTSWPETLNITLLGYRISVHSSTGKTPFELMFGRRCGQFDSWIELEKEIEKQAIQQRQQQLKQLHDETIDKAIESITKAQEKQAKYQNLKSNATHDNLKIGDQVFIKNCKLVKDKFEPEYFGPFKIKDRNISSGNYVIVNQAGVQLEETFPRWKLKPTEFHTESNKEDKSEQQIDKSR